ncbi:MAG: sigma-54 interaction domain-containing protein, partial [Eubacteriales bacterium]
MKINKKMSGKNVNIPLEYICFTEKKKYIINGLPEGWEDVLTLVVNKEGEICYVKNYEKILQISSKKVIGRMLRKLEPDAVMLQVLKNGRPDFNIERRLPSIRGLTVKAIDIPLLYEGDVVGGLIFYAPQEKSTNIELLKINTESCLGRLIIQSSSLLSSDSIHLWSGNKIIGRSCLFREALKLAMNVARTNFDVLLSGETGVGKEVFAEVIHLCSARRQGPFVKINCAAIPESLFESELFGYEGGSFTGANPKGKKGLFEEANGGTLLLDEVGEVSLNTQGKILRALQNKEVQRVGGKKPRTVDVRVIAATNRNLNELVNEGAFREDLYYRLNVIPICIPPLRLREHDLDLIADYIY